jgi:excisionase family DNA binding protein
MTQLLTITEAAQRLGRPRDFLYGLVALGLPTFRFHPRGTHYIDAAELDTWLQGRKTLAVVAPPAVPATDAEECAALGIPVEHEFTR